MTEGDVNSKDGGQGTCVFLQVQSESGWKTWCCKPHVRSAFV